MQQEIVTSLFGTQEDVVVGRMIGTGELLRSVQAGRTTAHQQVALLWRGSTEGHQTTKGCRGSSIRRGGFNGIALFVKNLRLFLSVIIRPYRYLLIIYAFYHPFIQDMMTEVGVVVLLIVIHHIASTQFLVGILCQALSKLFSKDERHHALQIVLLCSRQAMQRVQRTLYLWSHITLEEVGLLWSLQQHIGL